MLKAARIFLALGIIALAIGTMARIGGFDYYNQIPVVGVTPQAFWEGSLSLLILSGCFSLLEIASRGSGPANPPKKDDESSE